MKILKIHIEKYKQFDNFIANFSNKSNIELPNYKFIVGENGSGKTTLLEAIASIFSNAFFNKSPGFIFYLEYSIINSENRKEEIIFLTNTKNDILENQDYSQNDINFGLIKDGKRIYFFNKNFSDYRHLHPQRIFTLSSGPNNYFEEIVTNNPYRDFVSKKENFDDFSLEKEIDLLLFNPKIINFDIKMYTYIFISLLFFGEESNKNNLLNSINKKVKAESFSIEVDMNIFDNIMNVRENVESAKYIFKKNFISFLNLHDSYIEKDINNSRVYTFEKNKINFYKDAFNSLEMCILFSIGYRLGLFKNADVYIKLEKSKDMLTQDVLSDGEWMWLNKIGMVIISQVAKENNFLYLFDEPDLFLNEKWIEKYISNLNLYTQKNQKIHSILTNNTNHEFIFTTHSTLLLTDALQSQVFVFMSHGKNELENISFAPFAANRDYISSKLNFESKKNKKYSDEVIHEITKKDDKDLLNDLIEEVGFGFERLRLERIKSGFSDEWSGEKKNAD